MSPDPKKPAKKHVPGATKRPSVRMKKKTAGKTATPEPAVWTASFRIGWLKEELRDFWKMLREPEAVIFIVLGFVFATKALELMGSLSGKLPLFNFVEGILKSLGGEPGSISHTLFVKNAARYARRLPAIVYQLLLPLAVLWFMTWLRRRGEVRPEGSPCRRVFGCLVEAARGSGFRVDTLREWWVWLLFFFMIMTPVIIAVATSPAFRGKYPYLLELRVGKAFDLFLVYQAIRGLYMLSWEYLFRGFMISTLRERFGYYAVFFQMLPYVMLHSTKPSLELYYTIPSALLLGVLAYRTRSVWPGFLLHFVGAVLFDFIALYA